MQYRRAIRHPQPAEREYLAAQSTGTGVHVGYHVQGGWLVDAAMAESPAEEAGIVRGDCITEISRLCLLCLSKICFVAHCFREQHSPGIEKLMSQHGCHVLPADRMVPLKGDLDLHPDSWRVLLFAYPILVRNGVVPALFAPCMKICLTIFNLVLDSV